MNDPATHLPKRINRQTAIDVLRSQTLSSFEWKDWRPWPWPSRISLRDVDLSGCNLSSFNFHGIDFHGANFRGAKLQGTSFTDTDLQNAIFDGADLYCASFSCACLKGASLRSANLYMASLGDADLTEADLSDSRLCHAGFQEACLQRARLERADLWGANLSLADLHNADLSDCNFKGADLHEAVLRAATLTRANFSGADLTEADLYGANYIDADLGSARVKFANFTSAFRPLKRYHGLSYPEDRNCTLWRFMDLFKFTSLMTSTSLFLCRADKFVDPLEGHIPQKNLHATFEEIYPVMGMRTASYAQSQTEVHAFWDRQGTLVNCWGMHENPTLQLWHEYVGDRTGVAVQTTFQRLVQSIKDPAVRFGMVKYIDIKDGYIAECYGCDRNSVLTAKDLSYKFEKELRVLLFDQHKPDKTPLYPMGKLVPVDLKTLIQAVYLSPYTDVWDALKIRWLLRSHGLRVPLYDLTNIR